MASNKIDRIIGSLGEWTPAETAELAGAVLVEAGVDNRENIAAFVNRLDESDREALMAHLESLANDRG